jgi:hypothetical protein
MAQDSDSELIQKLSNIFADFHVTASAIKNVRSFSPLTSLVKAANLCLGTCGQNVKQKGRMTCENDKRIQAF